MRKQLAELMGLSLLALNSGSWAQSASVVQASLIRDGSTPFHLQAVITETGDPSERFDVEMFWVSPHKWKRTIESQEFSQTQVVNGDRVFEKDSDQYMPLAIQVLTTAMVDPQPIIDALRPGDMVMTKANGAADESGKLCFSPDRKLCGMSRYGLTESLRAPGRSVDFMDYHDFRGKRVARMLTYHIDHGDAFLLRINNLAEYKSDNDAVFSISESTPPEKRIRSVIVQDSELRELAWQPTEVIWPQVLEDHVTSGETSYYVSVDRLGQVREVLPLSVAIERADDSARRQIMKWKFKPVVRDGVAVQAEAVFNLHFNTRAYGPAAPLSDAEVRKLAAQIAEPEFPPGIASGAAITIFIAIDEEGKLIESIIGEGAHEIGMPCQKSLGGWRFRPFIEDGKPRPYRGQIICRAP